MSRNAPSDHEYYPEFPERVDKNENRGGGKTGYGVRQHNPEESGKRGKPKDIGTFQEAVIDLCKCGFHGLIRKRQAVDEGGDKNT